MESLLSQIQQIPLGYYVPVFWCFTFFLLSIDRYKDDKNKKNIIPI